MSIMLALALAILPPTDACVLNTCVTTPGVSVQMPTTSPQEPQEPPTRPEPAPGASAPAPQPAEPQERPQQSAVRQETARPPLRADDPSAIPSSVFTLPERPEVRVPEKKADEVSIAGGAWEPWEFNWDESPVPGLILAGGLGLLLLAVWLTAVNQGKAKE